MADTQEEVVYSFEGDVSSLRQATQEALSLLDRYDAAFKASASKSTFTASKTSTTGFQRAVGGLIRQVNSLAKSLNTAGSAVEAAMPDGTAIVKTATKDLADVLDYLSSSTKTESSDLKFLTEVLKTTKNDMEAVASRAQVLAHSMKPLEKLQTKQTLQSVGNAAQTTQKHFEAAAKSGFRVQQAYVASGKSAADSAAFFIKASRAAAGMQSAQGVIQKLRTEMNLFGANAKMAWEQFAHKIDPTGVKIQSLKDKAAKSFGQIKSVMSQVSSAFRRTSSEADDSDKSYKKLASRVTQLSSKLRDLGTSTRRGTDAFNLMTRASKGLRNALRTLVGVQLGSWLSEAAKQSISYIENLNLFTVAMGDSLEAGTAFINKMAELYGMDPSSLMRYAGNFYQLADAIDMPDESAAKLSLSLLKATNDISSLFNMPIETVFNDLSSGMQGMSRAVRKYGMDIRVTTLQQTALSLGISDNVENMSEANRQGLRFITMMRQASNASGDFAKNINQPANQLKIFKEQLAVLGRSIGNLFLKPLSTAIVYINGFIMALNAAISFISSLFGIVTSLFGGSVDTTADSADKIADSVGGIGSAAGGAAKKLKQMLAPFDELNILQDQAASGDGGGVGGALSDLGTLDPAIAAEIENMKLQLEDIRMKAVEVRDALLEFFGFQVENGAILSWDASVFEANLINKFPQWTQTIQAVFDNWTDIVHAFGRVLEALAGIAQAVWDKVVGFISKFVNDDSVSAYISGLAGSLNSFADFLNTNQDAIANFVIALGALSVAFRGLSSIGPLVGPIANLVAMCVSALASMAPLIGLVTGIVAVIAVLYTTSTTFATAFNNLIVSIGEGLGAVFTAFWEAMQVVWSGIQTLWNDNILPMLTSIGDAIAPVVHTIINLWEDMVAVVVDVFDTVESVWTTSLEPALAAFFDAIANLAKIFGTLWSEVIGPVVKHIGEGIVTLWGTTLRPIFENIIAIIGGVAEIVLWLWNTVLAPVINWLVDVLAPVFVNVFNAVWTIVQSVVSSIGQSINGLLEILRGIIDFIAGVFTGDWERVWQGVVRIFKGVWDTLAGIVKIVLNAVIGVINVALGAISGAINAIIRAVNKISFKAPDWIPGVGGKTLGFNLKQVGTWSIPYLASGAVVTSPTVAMIGEGKYDEAVIPLGNSPQMKNLVNQIAEATKTKGAVEPVQVNVYIGNEQIAEYTYRVNRRMQLQTNGGI